MQTVNSDQTLQTKNETSLGEQGTWKFGKQYRTRRATSEDSDHRCKGSQILPFVVWLNTSHRFIEGFNCVLRRLIWVYTVCSGLSVRIRRVSTEIRSNRIPSEIILDPPLIHKKEKKMLGPTRKIRHRGICNYLPLNSKKPKE